MPVVHHDRLRFVVQACWGFGVWAFVVRMSDHVGSMGAVIEELCHSWEVHIGSGTEPDQQ